MGSGQPGLSGVREERRVPDGSVPTPAYRRVAGRRRSTGYGRRCRVRGPGIRTGSGRRAQPAGSVLRPDPTDRGIHEMASVAPVLNRVQTWVQAVAQTVTDRRAHSSRPVPDDLTILGTDVVYTADGALDYIWYLLEERINGCTRRYYKAICLNVLTYLPRETREQTNIFEKARKALKGLHSAGVDFVHLYGNLKGFGFVQIYGAQGISEKGLEDAVSRARQGLAAVRAVLANFEQSRMSPVGLALGETLREAFLAPLAIVV
ncbi:MAG: hypothetical protein J7575_08080, partial [Chloroflexi bacterium]|nr:hypothetical protein [Chloroflexota bacterium]